ncbi:MAG: hypothetical protein ABI760_15885 [Ferruginibacter sp.]
MSDIAENIDASIEQSSKNKINSRVALFVAITATFMALCNVKDRISRHVAQTCVREV